MLVPSLYHSQFVRFVFMKIVYQTLLVEFIPQRLSAICHYEANRRPINCWTEISDA